jgi:hypothetical protein
MNISVLSHDKNPEKPENKRSNQRLVLAKPVWCKDQFGHVAKCNLLSKWIHFCKATSLEKARNRELIQ